MVDSSAQTNAEAGPASAGRDGAGPERVDDGPADRQLTAAGASSNTQANGHSSNQGSPGVGNRESSRTTNDGADAPKRSATPISSSHLLPPAQTIPSGSVIQQMLVNLSDREIAARALVGSGAQAIAVSSAAGRQQDTSLAALPGNGSVNPKTASILQKSSAQENDSSTRGESFDAVNAGIPKATISPANPLISALAFQAPAAQPLQQASSSGSTPRDVLMPASEQSISQQAEAGANPQLVAAGQLITEPGLAPPDSIGQTQNSPKVDSSAPQSSQIPGVPSSAAIVSDPPARFLVQDDSSVSTGPGSAKAGQTLGGQQSGSSTSDGSAGTSSGNVAVHTAAAVQEMVSQLLALRPVTELAQMEKPASTSKAPSATAAQAGTIDGKSSTPATANTGAVDQTSASAPATGQVFILPVNLPMTAALASNVERNQASDNAVQKSAAGLNGSGNPLLASKSDTATSNTTNSANGSGGGSSQGGQNAQSSQNAQVDPSRTVDVAPRATDNSASQAQTQAVPTQAALPESATPHRASDAPDLPSLPSEHQDNPASIHSDSGEAVAASSINSAKLLQTMSESEMRVGIRSTEFGDISIRTSVSQQQMVTQISLDHSDLSQAISAHVSTMQAKLGEDYGLHASIEVHNLGSSLAGDSGQSSHGEQRAFSHSARSDSNPFQPEEEAGLSLAAMAVAGSGNRLDIRA